MSITNIACPISGANLVDKVDEIIDFVNAPVVVPSENIAGNTLFVNPLNANASDAYIRTEALGRPDKPFLTLQAAINVANTNDSIYIYSNSSFATLRNINLNFVLFNCNVSASGLSTQNTANFFKFYGIGNASVSGSWATQSSLFTFEFYNLSVNALSFAGGSGAFQCISNFHYCKGTSLTARTVNINYCVFSGAVASNNNNSNFNNSFASSLDGFLNIKKSVISGNVAATILNSTFICFDSEIGGFISFTAGSGTTISGTIYNSIIRGESSGESITFAPVITDNLKKILIVSEGTIGANQTNCNIVTGI